MQVKVPIIQLILGTLVSIVIAMAVEFFVFSVDYSRTEYAQFEDDEYYYYVKAVPKTWKRSPPLIRGRAIWSWMPWFPESRTGI